MLHRMVGHLARGAALIALAACANDSAAPSSSSEEPLLAALDEAAHEANQRGDADASSAYSGAAMAYRLGIRPTPIQVTVAGQSERYHAFVHLLARARPGARPARLRTMVAVRGETRPDRILYLATLADSAALGRPTMTLERRADFLQLAWASWKDLENRVIWVGTGGKAGIEEISLGGDCPNVSGRAGVTCTAGTFAVLLEGAFHPLVANQRGVIDASTSMRIGTRADDVNGAVLVFP